MPSIGKSITAKILLIGDGAVGKTSLRKRFTQDQFNPYEGVTIGAQFTRVSMQLNNGYEVYLQIWDISGQANFQMVAQTYYQGAKGAILVFDATRESTFNNLPYWIKALMKYNYNRKIPVVLVGNKVDLIDERQVSAIQGHQYAKELTKYFGWKVNYFETSAKTGENVALPFTILSQQVYEYWRRHLNKLGAEYGVPSQFKSRFSRNPY